MVDADLKEAQHRPADRMPAESDSPVRERGHRPRRDQVGHTVSPADLQVLEHLELENLVEAVARGDGSGPERGLAEARTRACAARRTRRGSPERCRPAQQVARRTAPRCRWSETAIPRVRRACGSCVAPPAGSSVCSITSIAVTTSKLAACVAHASGSSDRNAEPAGLGRDRSLLEPAGSSSGPLADVADEAPVATAEIEPADAVQPSQQALDQPRDSVPLVAGGSSARARTVRSGSRPADRPPGRRSSDRRRCARSPSTDRR